jgi:hypothetical protein
MYERRTKRSAERCEALQYLVEHVADRSRVQALVLVDDDGHIMAGTGIPRDVVGLVRTARGVARGTASADQVDLATRGADVTARPVATPEGTLYFAAMGDRVSGVGDAVRAVQRIYSETLPL